MKELAISVMLVWFAVMPASGNECRHEASRQAEISAAGARVVQVIGRAGSLDVVGVTGTTVRARGTACTSEADLLDDIRLTATRRGDRVIFEAVIPEVNRWTFGSFTKRLDFTVEVPSGLHVEVEDGSGSLDVRNVGSAEIDDGSGSISVREVAGRVTVRDGSGGIEIRQVGEVHLVDGSGGIDVRQVRGDVVIEEDGSGSIDIQNVGGQVLVERDSSGSIDVRDVAGAFEVLRDGSGRISHREVRGRVSLPED